MNYRAVSGGEKDSGLLECTVYSFLFFLRLGNERESVT